MSFYGLTIESTYKKIATATTLLFLSTTAFASFDDCMYQTKIQSKNGVLKECINYVNKDSSIMAMVFSAYAAKKNNIEAMKYSKMYIKEYGDYKSNADDISFLASAYSILGNIYYFGQAEPKYPKDTTKGLEYITKGAELGSFYGSGKTLSKNWSMSYYWYELGKLNGGSSYSRQHPSYVHQNMDFFMKNGLYCIAIGQDNVGQAYYKGIGIAQSDSKAIEWLEKAYATDPSLSVTTLDLAKMYYNTGDKDKAFEYAQKAISQPLAQAYQYLATFYILGTATDKDPVKAAAYMTVAVDLYKSPATDFWNKFEPTCMPNYEGTTDEFNQDYAEKQLADIKLTGEQKDKVAELVSKFKDELKGAKV